MNIRPDPSFIYKLAFPHQGTGLLAQDICRNRLDDPRLYCSEQQQPAQIEDMPMGRHVEPSFCTMLPLSIATLLHSLYIFHD